jgi:hypothetical protein
MRHQKSLVTARGLLYSMAVALVPTVTATALVLTPVRSMALVSQEPQQHPQPKPDQQKPDTQPPDTSQQTNKAVVVTGMIVKSGSDFILKDASGTVYKLDAPEKAEPFEGKSVKVTGQLDTNASLLHVEAIEVVTA